MADESHDELSQPTAALGNPRPLKTDDELIAAGWTPSRAGAARCLAGHDCCSAYGGVHLHCTPVGNCSPCGRRG